MALLSPNVGGKPVIGLDGLLALLIFNIAYDTGIFYSRPRTGSFEEIFGQEDHDSDPGPQSRLLSDHMLSQAVRNHGRPKAHCYEDLRSASSSRDRQRRLNDGRQAVSFVSIPDEDRADWFYGAFFFFVFCPITVVVGLAIRNKAFDAVNLMSAQAVFQVRNWGPVQCTPLRWKESMLRAPIPPG
ncbi:hypothetical protein V8E54_004107 [Elaphomyces granulatus]